MHNHLKQQSKHFITFNLINSALFIGRFQPLHIGHLSVIKKALQEVDYLIIAIGSAEDSFQPENPFTASERLQMIKNSLDYENIDPKTYCIIPIRNINNFNLWCKHVESLTPPFQSIYTGSPLVKKLFELENKYKIKKIKFEFDIHSTKIREDILKNDDWKNFVPQKTIEFLEKIDAKKRLEIIKSSISK